MLFMHGNDEMTDNPQFLPCKPDFGSSVFNDYFLVDQANLMAENCLKLLTMHYIDDGILSYLCGPMQNRL